jgi:hypothetical protein
MSIERLPAFLRFADGRRGLLRGQLRIHQTSTCGQPKSVVLQAGGMVQLVCNTISQQKNWARASSLSRLQDHTQPHHIQQDSSGRVISPTQRPLPDNTKHTQVTDIHVSDGIGTRNPSKRAAADPRLRPRGHQDRQNMGLTT